jgi:hypothetical protein
MCQETQQQSQRPLDGRGHELHYECMRDDEYDTDNEWHDDELEYTQSVDVGEEGCVALW